MCISIFPPTKSERTLLEISNLNITYPGHESLAVISWQIEAGQQIALLGRSGAGKSTLLNTIVRGSPHIRNQSKRLAYLAQKPALLPWLSVIDNVLLGFKLRGEPIDRCNSERALDLLTQVNLESLAHRKANQLSGGQSTRVALARLLIEDADLILLDEPFASLDRSTRIQMATLCKTLLDQRTVILVTHDPRDAADWLGTAMVLSNEKLEGPFKLSDFNNDDVLINALGGDL
jgi:putative hydroxymethylpyrimidine transport system ATP-binding protein